jgi:adenylate kinase family enzyme
MKISPSRIMIFGRPGSGKSTFAHDLHKITGLPLHHLDKHFFTRNWVERDKQEFLDIQQSIVDTDSWIIDGNSIKSLEMRYAKADLVLCLNFPRWICLYRVLKRILFPNTKINDRAEGCKDSLSWKLLEYMWTFDQRVEKPIAYLRKKYPNIKFEKITNDRTLRKVKLAFVNGEFSR